jgi:hypothetical protein
MPHFQQVEMVKPLAGMNGSGHRRRRVSVAAVALALILCNVLIGSVSVVFAGSINGAAVAAAGVSTRGKIHHQNRIVSVSSHRCGAAPQKGKSVPPPPRKSAPKRGNSKFDDCVDAESLTCKAPSQPISLKANSKWRKESEEQGSDIDVEEEDDDLEEEDDGDAADGDDKQEFDVNGGSLDEIDDIDEYDERYDDDDEEMPQGWGSMLQPAGSAVVSAVQALNIGEKLTGLSKHGQAVYQDLFRRAKVSI